MGKVRKLRQNIFLDEFQKILRNISEILEKYFKEF